MLQENNVAFLIGRDIREINQLNFEVWQKFPKILQRGPPLILPCTMPLQNTSMCPW